MKPRDDGMDPDTGRPLYNPPPIELRDYFAGQALIAMLPVYAGMNGGTQNGIGTDHICPNVAHHAYRMADAMLEARKR